MILKRVQEPYHESLHNGLVTHIISAVTYYIACIVTVGRPSNFEIDGFIIDNLVIGNLFGSNFQFGIW